MKKSTLIYISSGVVILILMYVIYKRFFNKENKNRDVISNEVETPKSKIEIVIDKLNENGAVLYGIEGCSWCKKQLGEFGNYSNQINYVDCSKNNEGICKTAKGFPFWTLKNNESIEGYHNLDNLLSKLE